MTNFLAFDKSMEEIIAEELKEWASHWKELKANTNPDWDHIRGDYGGKSDMPDVVVFEGQNYSPEELYLEVETGTQVGKKILEKLYFNAQNLSYLGSNMSEIDFLEKTIIESGSLPNPDEPIFWLSYF